MSCCKSGRIRPRRALSPVSAILFFIFVAGAASASPSWTHVTVARADGSELVDVTLTWVLDGFGLEAVAGDGSRTALRPLEVAAIRSRDGADITDEVAVACPARDVHFALIGSGRPDPFVVGTMVRVGGSATWHRGPGSSTTWRGNVAAGLRFGLTDRVHLALDYRRQGLKQTVSGVPRELTSSADELHLLLGIRLKDPRENANYPYLEAGPALVAFASRYDTDAATWTDEDRRKLAFSLRGGVLIPLDSAWAVDLSGSFMVRPPLALGGDEDGPAMMLGLGAAVTYRR